PPLAEGGPGGISLDAELQIPLNPLGPSGSPFSKGEVPFIRFRDVWFAYKEDDFVLKAFNLELEKGEKIALVGETGGGKTTVTRLLSRLYAVQLYAPPAHVVKP